MKPILLIIALLLSTHAAAGEASKRAKILQLAKVQGMEQMFQQQLDQSRASIATMGNDMMAKVLADSGVPASPEDPQFKKIMVTYLERAALMFSAKEYADIWSRSYGQDLSEADIDQMLKYYNSPLGQRDVRASHAAMGKFSQTIAAESERRFTDLSTEMLKELNAVKAK